MKYKCANCRTEFITTLTKGVLAAGHGGVCPNCGVKDGDNGMRFEVLFSPTSVKENKRLLTEPLIPK